MRKKLVEQMKDRQELIRNIIGLQVEMSRFSMARPVENWMNLSLTIDQLKSLIFIQYHGKISFKDIAQALGTTRGNVTGIISRLIKNGLVTRQPNPNDRRVQYLMLTAKALELLDNIKQMVTKEEVNILSGLNIEDLAAMEQGLTAFVKHIEIYMSNKHPEI
jgi:DNA-binding MarR family transcriptional regulator